MAQDSVFVFTDPDLEVNFTHIHRTCNGCQESYTIFLNQKHYNAWYNGAFIQDAFPYLTTGQREMIKTGYHSNCFDKLFAESP